MITFSTLCLVRVYGKTENSTKSKGFDEIQSFHRKYVIRNNESVFWAVKFTGFSI